MTLFSGFPEYTQFRPLFDQTPGKPPITGEDVYALQTGLTGCGVPCGPSDGILGPMTGKAIWDFQTQQGLVRDGRAGPATNRQLVELLCVVPNGKYRLPTLLLFGQISHEASLYPGRYSPARSDGSYDAGIAQRNTEHTPPEVGFDTPASISALAKNTRDHYNLFANIPGRRRWMLAAGAWNAPAYACLIAYQELVPIIGQAAAAAQIPASKRARSIGETARAKFEAYMADVTKMMP